MARVPASERRADLVQAAIQVATREGLAATTTRRIAQELGISVGIVHYVFRSKEELLHEVIRVIADAQVVAARSAIVPGADLASSVRNAFLGFWQLVEATPEAQLLTYELTSWALRNAETEPLAREQRASQLAGIVEILHEISDADQRHLETPRRPTSPNDPRHHRRRNPRLAGRPRHRIRSTGLGDLRRPIAGAGASQRRRSGDGRGLGGEGVAGRRIGGFEAAEGPAAVVGLVAVGALGFHWSPRLRTVHFHRSRNQPRAGKNCLSAPR